MSDIALPLVDPLDLLIHTMYLVVLAYGACRLWRWVECALDREALALVNARNRALRDQWAVPHCGLCFSTAPMVGTVGVYHRPSGQTRRVPCCAMCAELTSHAERAA